MKKFLNCAVAAIAAGCFLMPSAECVTGGESCADGKNTGTETCSELKPEYKLHRTMSLPNLRNASVRREIKKRIPGDTYNQIQKVLEDRSSFVADSPIKLDSYEIEKSISENLFKLGQELRKEDLRIRKMLYGIEQKYLSYWENSENLDCSPEDDIKKRPLRTFYLNLFLEYFGFDINSNDISAIEVLACLKGMTYQEFRQYIDKIMENIRGESLSKISISKYGNVYKLKLFFKARRTYLGEVRSIPVMGVVDFFS